MADVSAFVLALIDEDAYEAAYVGCDAMRADLNGDEIKDGRDVVGFATALLSGGCS